MAIPTITPRLYSIDLRDGADEVCDLWFIRLPPETRYKGMQGGRRNCICHLANVFCALGSLRFTRQGYLFLRKDMDNGRHVHHRVNETAIGVCARFRERQLVRLPRR